MKQPYVAVLIGIVILLVGIEILLIYTNIDKISVLTVACTTQANESIMVNREMKIRNKTRTTIYSANTTDSITTSTISSEYSTEKITKTSEETTTERTTTMPSRGCRIQHASRITHPSPSKIRSPTTTNDKTMMDTTKTTLITTLPTISTTLITNQTEDTVTVSGIPNTTSRSPSITSSTLIMKITNACKINVTESSSPFTTTTTTPIVTLPPMPPTTHTSMSHTSTITSTTAKTSLTTVDRVNATTEVTTRANTSCRTRITTSKFNYVLRDAEKGTACVLANMTIHINLKHTTKDSQVSKSTLTVPVNATTTGFCGEKTANMTLSWEEAAENQMGSTKRNKMTFNYAHNNVKFFLESIFVDMHLNEKEIKENITTDRQLFSAAVKQGIFICEIGTAININNRLNVVISDVYLTVFDECFDDGVKIETICIVRTNIKISGILSLITIGITIVIVSTVLIFFVLYLIWYVRRWFNKFAKGDKRG